MNYCQTSVFITGIANALASQLTASELNLLGAILTQLGDTLETISVQREIADTRTHSCGTN